MKVWNRNLEKRRKQKKLISKHMKNKLKNSKVEPFSRVFEFDFFYSIEPFV
jgi:hypothetical protein